MKPYWEHPVLRQAVLDESWIATVIAAPGSLTVMIDAALPENSPLWREPLPGEVGSWRKAVLRFLQVEELRWIDPGTPQAENDGSLTYNTFHVVEFDGNRYHLGSDAGEIHLTAEDVAIEFEPEASGS